jgi:CubicO group peptidase (beta-lactamase class C family)
MAVTLPEPCAYDSRMLTSGEPLSRPPSTTGRNWQEAPHNRWAFWHLRELLPTQRVDRGDGPVRPLPDHTADHDVMGVEVSLADGSTTSVADVFEHTFTDAYAVAQDGRLVAEGYASTGGPGKTHAVLSVTKAVVGCVAGVLAGRGLLDVDRGVVDYVPELADSGFEGATVRHLLDMRSGVRFREEYTNPNAEIRRLGRWVVAGSTRGTDTPRGLYPFLTTLRAEAPHGSRFLYRSAETDALGWVCERAGGARMADLVSTLLWAPMGAERDADLLCDRLGAAVHDGGLATTARDLLRFGQLLLDGGAVPDDTGEMVQVVPALWLRDSWAVTSDVRSAFAASPAELSFPGGWYRNQLWFRPGRHGDVLLGLGIHGQLLHVCRRTRTVTVKLSSWPEAQHATYLHNTLAALDAIGGALAYGDARDSTRHLPGVVSGLDRRGTRSRRRGDGSVV